MSFERGFNFETQRQKREIDRELETEKKRDAFEAKRRALNFDAPKKTSEVTGTVESEKAQPAEEALESRLERREVLTTEEEQSSERQEMLEEQLYKLEREDCNAVQQVAEEFEAIAQRAATPEQKEQLDKLRGKVVKSGGRFLKMAKFLTALALFSGTATIGVRVAEHYISHQDLETKIDNQGKTEYVHPDAETNHLLNVLAGRDSITYDEALDNYKANFKESRELAELGLPKDFDTYNINQLDSFIVNDFNRKAPIQVAFGSFAEAFKSSLQQRDIKLSPEQSQKIYDLVWQVEQECGNPKLRLQRETSTKMLGNKAAARGVDRPHFNTPANTVYLPLSSFTSRPNYHHWFAELSHAKQANDNQAAMDYQNTVDFLRAFSKAGFNREKLGQAIEEDYEIPGSVEYEAHKKIQPTLEKKYSALFEQQAVDKKIASQISEKKLQEKLAAKYKTVNKRHKL